MKRPRKSTELKFIEKVRRIKEAGLESMRPLHQVINADLLPLETLDTRIERLVRVLKNFQNEKRPEDMLFFVMYDIEHNKIRTHIARFLLRKGCKRVQRSVFVAQLKRVQYEEIHKTLKEIQEAYDNHDSIMFVPIADDNLRAMRIIGQQLDFELVTDRKNVLFF
jgi:CRISPR-associated endonuclease Cas2